MMNNSNNKSTVLSIVCPCREHFLQASFLITCQALRFRVSFELCALSSPSVPPWKQKWNYQRVKWECIIHCIRKSGFQAYLTTVDNLTFTYPITYSKLKLHTWELHLTWRSVVWIVAKGYLILSPWPCICCISRGVDPVDSKQRQLNLLHLISIRVFTTGTGFFVPLSLHCVENKTTSLIFPVQSVAKTINF